MAASSSCKVLPTIHSLSSPSSIRVKANGHISSLLCPNSFTPISISTFNATLNLNSFRLKIASRTSKASKHVSLFPTIFCLADDSLETYPESGQPSVPTNSRTEGTFDLKLPRRSLLVKFTCNACGERSQKFINRSAYERGTVFIQCSGCYQYHKLVDNLGLVVEYDFRKETGTESNADQV